jgi:hypothetical protein
MRPSTEWLLAQFPDLHMKIEAIVAEGNLVAVRVLSEEFAFWIGFALPLGPVFGVVRTGLVPWLGLSFVPLIPAAALKPVREERVDRRC